MRTSLLVAVSFAFVVSSAVVARSQEEEQALINDVETSPARNAANRPTATIRSRPQPADAAKAKSKQAAANEGDDQDAAIRSTAKPEEPAKAESNQAAAKEGGAQDAAAGLPATLDEALAKALRSNPEVLLAEATVRQAQAEYNQAKLKAVQDVTVAFQQWNALQEKRKYDQKMHEKGYVGASEIRQLTSELAETEAKLAYLMGVGAELHSADGSARNVILTPKGIPERIYVLSRDSGEPVAKAGAPDKGAVEKRPEIPEKYRKILQKPMKVEFENSSFISVFEQIKQATSGKLPIIVPLDALKNMYENANILPDLADETSLHTLLEMVADVTGCVFIFRDYGLLVVPDASSASRYPRAATIPEMPLNQGGAGLGGRRGF